MNLMSWRVIRRTLVGQECCDAWDFLFSHIAFQPKRRYDIYSRKSSHNPYRLPAFAFTQSPASHLSVLDPDHALTKLLYECCIMRGNQHGGATEVEVLKEVHHFE